MEYFTLITTIGLSTIASAISHGNTVNITEMAFGDANGQVYDPTVDQTVLRNEKYRISINSIIQDEFNPHWLIVEAILPADVGNFYIQEIGLYAGNILIAVGNYPRTYKPVIADGITRELTIRMILQLDNADVVNLIVDPNISLATKQYVQDNMNQIMYQGIKPFNTYDDLLVYDDTPPALAKHQFIARVNFDADEHKNGDYAWNGSSFEKSNYDVLKILESSLLSNIKLPNLFFDSFNELVAYNSNFAGWDWLHGFPCDVIYDQSNIPLSTPKLVPQLQVRDGTGVFLDRLWDNSKIGIKVGDKLTVSVLCHSADVGLRLGLCLYNGQELLTLKANAVSNEIGLQVLTITDVVPDAPVTAILVRVYSTTYHTFEVGAYSASIGEYGASFTTAQLPTEYLQQLIFEKNQDQIISLVESGVESGFVDNIKNIPVVKNFCPDPFFRLFENGVSKIDDYPILNESVWSVVDYQNSPFFSKKVIYVPNPAQSRNKNIKIKRLGLRVGDVITIKAGMVLVDGGDFYVSCYARDMNNTVLSVLSSKKYFFEPNQYQEVSFDIVVTQQIMTFGEFVQFRLNVQNTVFVGGYYICGFACYINNPDAKILDTSYDVDEIYALTRKMNNVPVNTNTPYCFGEYYLRETRQRIRKLLLNESTQLIIASIGDSWTHNRDRWSGVTAVTLMEQLGDAGGGWLGFGFHPTLNVLVNGNVRADYGYSRVGEWTSVYGSSVSPDICHITSHVVGSKVICTIPMNPSLSGCDLFYIGSSDGVIRYRWNESVWLSVNLQGEANLNKVALVGFVAGVNTLEIEVVSGTCLLCGVNFKSLASGVVWHKLAATGSQARQWAAVNASKWQFGLSALKPNLVTIMHGTNDQGANRTVEQFIADLSVIIDGIKLSLPLADVLVIMPCENGRTNTVAMSRYADAVYLLCRVKKCAFIDLQKVFGDSFNEYSHSSERNWFHSDLVHPEPMTGGRAIVDAVVRFLMS